MRFYTLLFACELVNMCMEQALSLRVLPVSRNIPTLGVSNTNE